MRNRLLATGLVVSAALFRGPFLHADGPATCSSTAPASVPPPTDGQIRQAVGRLGHPSPNVRQVAIRQLAAWGPRSVNALHEAARGSDLETALSARELLAQIEPALFMGSEVHLEVDHPSVDWDQPFTLRVRVRNPSPAAIRLPWPAPKPSASRPAGDDADQVGRMFDLADFLTVTGPDGQNVELRFEPIDGDPAVYEAVLQRAGREPPAHSLSPNGQEIFEVPLFNRGWARYPLLAAGRYKIAFEYQPLWTNLSWIEEGLGRVTARPITVDVLRAAPEAIRKAFRPLVMSLHRRADRLDADVTSTWDRPIWLNLNFGPDFNRHAKLQWQFRQPQLEDENDWEPEIPAGDAAFRPEHLRRLDPGQILTIARLPIAVAREKTTPRSAPAPDSCQVALRYTNLLTAPQLRERWGDRVQPADIHSAVFTGVLEAEPLPLEPAASRSSP